MMSYLFELAISCVVRFSLFTAIIAAVDLRAVHLISLCTYILALFCAIPVNRLGVLEWFPTLFLSASSSI